MKTSENPISDVMSPGCLQTRNSLSEYADSTLSAHQMWEVEKHLAICQACTEIAHQMQATVQLLHQVERFDTGDDFMAKLHARLDGLEPEPMRRRTLMDRAQDLYERLRIDLTARRVPVLNFGIAAAAMSLFVVVAVVWRPVPTTQVSTTPVEIAHVIPDEDNLQRNLALTASDPLGDVAAETLRITDPTPTGGNGSHVPVGPDGG